MSVLLPAEWREPLMTTRSWLRRRALEHERGRWQVVAHGGRARDVDDLLVVALAAGRTWAEAAAVARCSETTVQRRMSDAGFRLRVQRQRDRMLSEATGAVVSALTGAASTLVSLLDASDDAIRLRAATAILATASKLHERVDIVQRLEVLEGGYGTE